MALSDKSRALRARAAAQRAVELSEVTGMPVSKRVQEILNSGTRTAEAPAEGSFKKCGWPGKSEITTIDSGPEQRPITPKIYFFTHKEGAAPSSSLVCSWQTDLGELRRSLNDEEVFAFLSEQLDREGSQETVRRAKDSEAST